MEQRFIALTFSFIWCFVLLPLLLAGSQSFQTKSQFSLSKIYDHFSLRACISKRAAIGEHTKNGVYMKGATVDLLLGRRRVVWVSD